MNKRVLFSFFSVVVVVAGTVVAIRYAQGYRPTRSGEVRSTGLLSANSFPNGASLYINGNLTSATDTTLNLAPGEYDIEIKKEGYFPWKKRMLVEKELVAQTNALLFPTAPGLTPLTYMGADHVYPSPDGQKILFTTASASASRNNGVYVLDLSDNPLALQKGPRQIARSTSAFNFEKSNFLWSPDSDQVLVSNSGRNILLDSNRFTDVETARDITITLPDLFLSWEDQLAQREQSLLLKFPLEIVHLATQSAKNVYISPDQERMIYTATAAAKLSANLIPLVPAASTQEQVREIVAGNTYVYDRKEDRNFLVQSTLPDATPVKSVLKPLTNTKNKTTKNIEQPKLQEKNDIGATIENFNRYYSGLHTLSPQWLPDSKHVIFIENGIISISEYDGTNKTQIYAGPFAPGFAYPWPNGTKLVVLTNFNQPGNVPQNLYAISLK
jgi:dipeptidyl aminopeptidase/acylaminoacyl peptidase